MIKRVLVLFVLAIAFCITACDDGGSGGNTATFVFSGTYDGSGDIDGKTVYAKFATGGCDASADFFEEADFVQVAADKAAINYSATATITLTNVPSGTYSACAFIDMNDNAAGDSSSMPDVGDITGDAEIIVPDETASPVVLNIDNRDDWLIFGDL